MPDKPTTASGYDLGHAATVRSACLYIATKLGDLSDDIVVVGGLVPTLIVYQETAPAELGAHVGTMDLDVGLTVALLDEGRYRKLSARLRDAGFTQDENAEGMPTRQRWRVSGELGSATVDFLMAPSQPDDKGGRLRNIEGHFAAIIAPGLDLAFRDRVRVLLDGKTIKGEAARREVWVCGPGAFVVLKALAFRSRGENKDAYDLFYVVRSYGSGVEDVAAALRPLLEDPDAQRAVEILREDFTDHDGLGPMRVAEFLRGEPDDDIQADVVGFVSELLRGLD